MFSFTTNIRVCYADTDQMGYVYYGNYARFFEIGRVEALRSIGITYSSLEKRGIMMPVLENYSKYIRPALYDDLLELSVFIKDMPTGARIRFDYEIRNEQKELLHIGHTILVFINQDTKKPIAFPTEIQDALIHFFK